MGSPSGQGPRFSIRMFMGIFCTDTVFVHSTIIHKYWDGNAVYPQALSQMASNDCSNSNLYDTLEWVVIAI